MSNDNKKIREQLERIYGAQCMLHKGLHIKGYSKSKIDYKGRSIREQLTLHHIKPRSLGGATSIENGAVLCRGCHDFVEQTSEKNRKNINELLKKYKEVKLQFLDEAEIKEPDFEVNILEIETTDKGMNIKKIKYNRAKQKEEIKKELEELGI